MDLWDLGIIQGKINKKIKAFTYTASTSGITNIVHNLPFNPLSDDLLVFSDGMLMTKSDNYTENVNNISIDLVGWSLTSGEIINFKLYKNVY
jgi:hypothetical protein